MHNYEDIIEKYRRELIEFSKQAPVHMTSDDMQYREVADVVSQPESDLPDNEEVQEPQAVIVARVPFENYEEFIANNRSNGLLRVQVFSGDRLFPVSNASVRVYVQLADGEREMFNGISDIDGVVDNISLPAPDSSVSFDENSTIEPYSVYGLRVSRPGYSSAVFTGIPVFDSVKSIQPVELVPLGASGDESEQRVIAFDPMTLYGGEG